MKYFFGSLQRMAFKLCVCLFLGLHASLADEANSGSQCTNQCSVKESINGNELMHLTVEASGNDTVRSYPITTYVEQLTVSLAMRNLRNETSDFAYTTLFHHGYGDEVKTINGIPDTTTHYWGLYINGQRAGCGMDTYRLKRGDKISWKLTLRRDEQTQQVIQM